ncbi:hypothetical protein X738_29995 [Mesorhizobium sp. LNHC209A00]|nr:hypothetical protein X738_29995 [Mesorhizobium sp. LNHC209A00]
MSKIPTEIMFVLALILGFLLWPHHPEPTPQKSSVRPAS